MGLAGTGVRIDSAEDRREERRWQARATSRTRSGRPSRRGSPGAACSSRWATRTSPTASVRRRRWRKSWWHSARTGRRSSCESLRGRAARASGSSLPRVRSSREPGGTRRGRHDPLDQGPGRARGLQGPRARSRADGGRSEGRGAVEETAAIEKLRAALGSPEGGRPREERSARACRPGRSFGRSLAQPTGCEVSSATPPTCFSFASSAMSAWVRTPTSTPCSTTGGRRTG